MVVIYTKYGAKSVFLKSVPSSNLGPGTLIPRKWHQKHPYRVLFCVLSVPLRQILCFKIGMEVVWKSVVLKKSAPGPADFHTSCHANQLQKPTAESESPDRMQWEGLHPPGTSECLQAPARRQDMRTRFRSFDGPGQRHPGISCWTHPTAVVSCDWRQS